MQKNVWNELAVIIVLVVFGSATVIWGYNKIQGHDLSDPPVFDLSVYDTLPIPSADEAFKKLDEMDQKMKEARAAEQFVEAMNDVVTKVPEASLPVVTPQLPAVVDPPAVVTKKPHTLYFAATLQGPTAADTKKAVTDLLAKVSGIKISAQYQDLLARECFDVSLPIEGREEVVASLEMEMFVTSLNANPAPAGTYNICFNQTHYYEELRSLLKQYPSVGVTSPDEPAPEYVASLPFDPVKPEHLVAIEQLKKGYGDVVLVNE